MDKRVYYLGLLCFLFQAENDLLGTSQAPGLFNEEDTYESFSQNLDPNNFPRNSDPIAQTKESAVGRVAPSVAPAVSSGEAVVNPLAKAVDAAANFPKASEEKLIAKESSVLSVAPAVVPVISSGEAVVNPLAKAVDVDANFSKADEEKLIVTLELSKIQKLLEIKGVLDLFGVDSNLANFLLFGIFSEIGKNFSNIDTGARISLFVFESAPQETDFCYVIKPSPVGKNILKDIIGNLKLAIVEHKDFWLIGKNKNILRNIVSKPIYQDLLAKCTAMESRKEDSFKCEFTVNSFGNIPFFTKEFLDVEADEKGIHLTLKSDFDPDFFAQLNSNGQDSSKLASKPSVVSSVSVASGAPLPAVSLPSETLSASVALPSETPLPSVASSTSLRTPLPSVYIEKKEDLLFYCALQNSEFICNLASAMADKFLSAAELPESYKKKFLDAKTQVENCMKKCYSGAVVCSLCRFNGNLDLFSVAPTMLLNPEEYAILASLMQKEFESLSTLPGLTSKPEEEKPNAANPVTANFVCEHKGMRIYHVEVSSPAIVESAKSNSAGGALNREKTQRHVVIMNNVLFEADSLDLVKAHIDASVAGKSPVINVETLLGGFPSNAIFKGSGQVVPFFKFFTSKAPSVKSYISDAMIAKMGTGDEINMELTTQDSSLVVKISVNYLFVKAVMAFMPALNNMISDIIREQGNEIYKGMVPKSDSTKVDPKFVPSTTFDEKNPFIPSSSLTGGRSSGVTSVPRPVEI